MTSPTAWSLAALRTHVRRTRSDDLAILELIHSIDRGNRIFVYHMMSARDALKDFLKSGTPQLEAEALLALLGGSDRQGEFEWSKIVNEAHLIGCLHTARGLWDIFAQLLNRLLIPIPLSVKACDIRKVAGHLPSSQLRTEVDCLLSSPWFAYVSAFINVTKHRQLIGHSATLSFEQDRAGIRVAAFDYERKTYPAYWHTEVLEGAIEVKNAVIACGRQLNAHLGI